jgi:hypothetical protein
MRRRRPTTPELAPVPECVRFHLWTGDYPSGGQFADGWLGAYSLGDAEKRVIWAEYREAIEAEGRAKGWRRRPRSWRPWMAATPGGGERP